MVEREYPFTFMGADGVEIRAAFDVTAHPRRAVYIEAAKGWLRCLRCGWMGYRPDACPTHPEE